MAHLLWTGTNGDWNDPSNWSGGVSPSPTDTVDFTAGTSVTVGGSSYVGTLDLNGANVTLAGDFSGDGTDRCTIEDGNTAGHAGTLTVADWASVTADAIGLIQTDISISGMLANNVGSVGNVDVAGPSGEWLTGNTQVAGTVSVMNGGVVCGTLSLGTRAAVVCDNLSTVEDGAIDVNGNASFQFVDSLSQAGSFSLGDAIELANGSTMSFICPSGSAVELNGPVSGSGTLNVSGASLVSDAQFSLSSQISIANGTLSASAIEAGNGAVALADSTLDLSSDHSSGSGSLSVNCVGSDDTVIGGAVAMNVDCGGAAGLDFTDGSGSATVTGGSSALSVTGGSGSEVVHCGTGGGRVTCGSGDVSVYAGGGTIYALAGAGDDRIWGNLSGNDTIVGGSGNDTLFGGSGASVYAKGSGATFLGTYATVDGALLDASASSGRDSMFAGGGSGVITMIGGSGSDLIVGGSGVDSVTCGVGNTTVFAGTGVGDTINGGSGSDLLVGGPGANMKIVGAGSDAAVSFGSGTSIDASHSSGSDTIWAAGTGATTITAGSGSECIVGTTSYMSVIGGSGALDVWGGPGGHDTILGGSGNDTLLGSSYSDVVATGSGNNVLISQGTAATLDASTSSGSNEFFLSASGSTNVLFGSGVNELVGGGQSADVFYQGGTGTIWAGMGSLDLTLGAQDFSGVLDVYQFNTSNSTIMLPNADYTESVLGGNMQIVCGNETIILSGITSLSPANVQVGHS